MSKHTPGTWEMSKHGTPAYHPQFGVYAASASDHVIVTGKNAEADAEFIVRACNAHDELLAALKRTLARLKSHTASIETCDLPSGTELAIDEACAAIAKSERNQ